MLWCISIHPPLAGRDLANGLDNTVVLDFNPPAPCGAGPASGGASDRGREISIHPPLAGRDRAANTQNGRDLISIHPPLAGRDGEFTEDMTEEQEFQSTRPLRGGTAILHKKTVQNIAYCTKSAFTLAVLSGFLALMRPFFLPNVHKFRCEPSEESLLAPRSHAYTIRTPSG